MAKKQYKKTMMRFEVLKPVRNDKTDKYFAIGETITESDFGPDIIRGWLEADPPVLREYRHGRNT